MIHKSTKKHIFKKIFVLVITLNVINTLWILAKAIKSFKDDIIVK